MSNEIWKIIPGYENRYQASTEGRIRSVPRTVLGGNRWRKEPFQRFLKGSVLRPGQYCKSGHLSVVLGRGTAGKPVHQLVALTFLGSCPIGMEVLHRNGNPQDNRLCNLRYGTRSENIKDVILQGKRWRKLSAEDVWAIRAAIGAGETCTAIARKLNVSVGCICDVKNGVTFGWLP